MIRRLATAVAVSAVAFSGLAVTAPAFAAPPESTNTVAPVDACTEGSGPGGVRNTIYEIQQRIDYLTGRARAAEDRTQRDEYQGRIIGLRAGLAGLETACDDWQEKVPNPSGIVHDDGTVTRHVDTYLLIDACGIIDDLSEQAWNSYGVAGRLRERAGISPNPSVRPEYERRALRSEHKARGLEEVIRWILGRDDTGRIVADRMYPFGTQCTQGADGDPGPL